MIPSSKRKIPAAPESFAIDVTFDDDVVNVDNDVELELSDADLMETYSSSEFEEELPARSTPPKLPARSTPPKLPARSTPPKLPARSPTHAASPRLPPAVRPERHARPERRARAERRALPERSAVPERRVLVGRRTAATAIPEKRRSSPSARLSWDEDAESHVADECLASIAAETSRARRSDPFLFLAAPGAHALAAPPSSAPVLARAPSQRVALASETSRRAATVPPPALSSTSRVSLAPRLPPVNAPPFLRGSRPFVRSVPPEAHDEKDLSGALETLPVPMKTPFARTTQSVVRAHAGAVRAMPTPSGSITPVALPSASEATVVVLHDRPRTAWILASAAVGAILAIAAMRVLLPGSGSAAPTNPTTAAAPTGVPTSAPAPKVVRFGEDEGVSINVPAPAAAAVAPAIVTVTQPVVVAPAPAHSTSVAVSVSPRVAAPHATVARGGHAPTPRVSAPTPLPDGSLGLASTGTSTASKPTQASTPLSVPVQTSRTRPLTPEQELAEAQLRAAIR